MAQPSAYSQGQSVEKLNNQWIPEQIVRTTTPPTRQCSLFHGSFEPLQWGLGALPDTPTSVESIQATSKAAQHWRESWLGRQREEAGPAIGVSRGQATVPEPLSGMQQDLARMRASIAPKNEASGKNSRLGFWLPIILLVCLIGGLGTYVFSTYSAGFNSVSSVSASTNAEPTLTLKNVKTTKLTAGQAVHVHGAQFGSNDTILFYLDAVQLHLTGGKPAIAQSNDKGVFDTMLSIPNTQIGGAYALQARDNATGQHTSLNIHVTAVTTTNAVQLSVPRLAFTSIIGHNNPHSQTESITNTGNAAISWSASAISDTQTQWLFVANDTTSGQLEAGQTAEIQVGVNKQDLMSNPAGHPYTGEIDFMILNQGQVVLPVKLTLSQTTGDFIVSPNPLIATQSYTTPGQCQPDTSLTLINLSDAPVNWNVQANDTVITFRLRNA